MRTSGGKKNWVHESALALLSNGRDSGPYKGKVRCVQLKNPVVVIKLDAVGGSSRYLRAAGAINGKRSIFRSLRYR